MIPGAFEYHRATSADEAVRLLGDNPGAKLLAGGHSLLPMMKLRLAAPPVLIDVRGIDALRFIDADGDDVVIGSMTSHMEIASSDLVGAAHPALREAAASIGDVQVRNRGTIGGSLAHADPAADYGAVVLALDAVVEVLGPDGARSVAAAELFAGLLSTSLAADELITGIRLPAARRSVYEKFEQPASGFAIVGVAAAIQAGDDGRCSEARIAATGIADRPLRLGGTEAALIGSVVDADSIASAAAAADAGIERIRADMYAAEDYRRHLLRVLTRRAITRATS